MHGFNGMGMGWGMGVGWIFGLLALIAIIWLIIRMVNTNNQGVPAFPNKNALTILDERYARGEITKEEYEDIKRDIL